MTDQEKEAARRKAKKAKTSVPVLSGRDFDSIMAQQVSKELGSIPDGALRKVLLKLLDGMDKSHFGTLKSSLVGYSRHLKSRSAQARGGAAMLKRSLPKRSMQSSIVTRYKRPKAVKKVSTSDFFGARKPSPVTSKPGFFGRLKKRVSSWWTS